MTATVTFTRDGLSVTATPLLEGEPLITGDTCFAAELTSAMSLVDSDPWLPNTDESTPLYNLCAAAELCGADMVSTSADDVTAIPADLDSFLR